MEFWKQSVGRLEGGGWLESEASTELPATLTAPDLLGKDASQITAAR